MPRAATAAARTGAHAERAPRQSAPRRRSGPARVAATAPALRALPLPRFVPSPSGLLDRLLRGRIWVVLIGSLLVGIVFFNVSVMRLNQTITRDSARATVLRQENSRLGVDAARLGSSERIQRLAAERGFVLPLPQDVRYLTVNPRVDSIRASHRIVPPQPAVAPGPISQVPQTAVAPTTTTAPTTGATGPAGTTAPATGPAGGATSGTTGPGATTPTTSAPTYTTPTSTTPTGGTAGGGGAP
jgi:hypothetical protein